DGSFGDVGMNSFNHYAYGAVGDWMYRTVGGIRPDDKAPGYRHVTIGPQPGGGITSARATYQSRYGQFVSSWKLDAAGQMTLDVTVPGNTTATVEIPAASRWAVTEGGRPVGGVTMAGGNAVVTVGSGSYKFAVDTVRGDLGEARVSAESIKKQAPALALTTAAGDLSYGKVSANATAAAVHLALAAAADVERHTHDA